MWICIVQLCFEKCENMRKELWERLAFLVKHIPVLPMGICHFCYQGKLRAAKWTFLSRVYQNLSHSTALVVPCCSLLHSYCFLALCRPEVYQRVLGSIFWVVSRESGAEVLCIFLNDISFLQSFCNCRKWTGFDGSSSPPKPCFCFEKHIFMTHNQMPCTWQLCDCCGKIWWRKFHLNSHSKDFCKSWVNFLTDQTFCLKKKNPT